MTIICNNFDDKLSIRSNKEQITDPLAKQIKMIFVKNCKLQVKKFNRTHYLNQTSDQDVYLFEWFALMSKKV